MRKALALSAALSLALCLSPVAALADEPATLVADRVFLTGTGTLSAEGNVEVFFQGTHLSASAIRYDPSADLLTIDGPIQLTHGTSSTPTTGAPTLPPKSWSVLPRRRTRRIVRPCKRSSSTKWTTEAPRSCR